MTSFQARGMSMFPTIREGDLVLVQPVKKEELILGDILAYRSKDVQTSFAHRLIRIDKIKDKSYYILQGDFKDEGIDTLVFEDIVGKVVGLERDNSIVDINPLGNRILKLIWNRLPILGRFILPFLKLPSIFSKLYFFTSPRFYIKKPDLSLLTIKDKFGQPEEVDFHSGLIESGLEDWEEDVVRKFLKRQARILDIGCGAGREAIALAKEGFEVMGIDIAPEMVKKANANAKGLGLNIKFETKSATEIDFSENYFDAVIFSRSVYSFIPSKPLRIETLKKIRKQLKPSGFIFLSAYILSPDFFSGQNLIDTLRKIRNLIFPYLFHSQPGDIWVRSVSPVSRTAKACFCHFFSSHYEITNEIRCAGLKLIDSDINNVFIASK